MSDILANDFFEILPVLTQNDILRLAVLALVSTEPMPGKSTEGDNRLDRFRKILADLVTNTIDLPAAYERVEFDLPRNTSIHADNNRVFPQDWGERLVRTQLSRFYNQAVMDLLLAEGETECYVPHSDAEDPGSPCSVNLAGSNQDLTVLRNRLIQSYRLGNFTRDVKIPNHPHCTHVVTRIQKGSAGT